AQAALRESDARLRDLVDNIPYVICIHDLEGRMLYLNPAGAGALGYPMNRLLTMNLAQLIAPDVRHEVPLYLAGVRAIGHAEGLMRVLRPDGEQPILNYDSMLRDESAAGGPVVRTVAVDVTERFRSMALQKAVFAGVHEPILAVGRDGNVLLSNPAA